MFSRQGNVSFFSDLNSQEHMKHRERTGIQKTRRQGCVQISLWTSVSLPPATCSQPSRQVCECVRLQGKYSKILRSPRQSVLLYQELVNISSLQDSSHVIIKPLFYIHKKCLYCKGLWVIKSVDLDETWIWPSRLPDFLRTRPQSLWVFNSRAQTHNLPTKPSWSISQALLSLS